MKELAIAGFNLRRLFRYRPNFFFIIIFPMLIILLLGATFGSGFNPAIGIAAEDTGALGEELVAALEAEKDLKVRRFDNEDDLADGVNRGRVEAGLVVPAGYDTMVRNGDTVILKFFSRPGSFGAQLGGTVAAVVSDQSVLVRASRYVEDAGYASQDETRARAEALSRIIPAVNVRVTRAGEALFPEELGKFDMGATSQLLLFVFLTSLTGSVALIETRQLGLSRRMLSTPTPVRTILMGEALGRIAVALLQGVIIMVGSGLLFGVNWGNPVGAGLVLVFFAFVGAGAGMVVGSVFSTEQQAIPIALLAGLGLAAIGGSMVPLEIFPDTMRTIAHFTPHAWGNDAFAELVRRNGSVVDILPDLGILAAFAAVLFTVATWRLRKVMTN